MALSGHGVNNELGKKPCANERDTWQCPNMKAAEDDTDMSFEHYACNLCGRRIALDYEEMK